MKHAFTQIDGTNKNTHTKEARYSGSKRREWTDSMAQGAIAMNAHFMVYYLFLPSMVFFLFIFVFFGTLFRLIIMYVWMFDACFDYVSSLSTWQAQKVKRYSIEKYKAKNLVQCAFIWIHLLLWPSERSHSVENCQYIEYVECDVNWKRTQIINRMLVKQKSSEDWEEGEENEGKREWSVLLELSLEQALIKINEQHAFRKTKPEPLFIEPEPKEI